MTNTINFSICRVPPPPPPPPNHHHHHHRHHHHHHHHHHHYHHRKQTFIHHTLQLIGALINPKLLDHVLPALSAQHGGIPCTCASRQRSRPPRHTVFLLCPIPPIIRSTASGHHRHDHLFSSTQRHLHPRTFHMVP